MWVKTLNGTRCASDTSQNAKQTSRDATRAQSKRAASDDDAKQHVTPHERKANVPRATTTQSNMGAKCEQISPVCYFYGNLAEEKINNA